MAQMHQVKGTCVKVEYLVLGPIENNVYVISDRQATIVVDPSCEPDVITEALGGREVDAIVLTHCHWDHVGAAAELRKRTGAAVIASQADGEVIAGTRGGDTGSRDFDPCPVDVFVGDGDVAKIGNMAWKVIATPGHTPGGICLFLDPEFGSNSQGAPVLVAGDTLFAGSIGRTDFPGGSMQDMKHSLKRLAALPDETVVLPGHNQMTRIGDERRRVFARFA
ncbi:MBL fold metallo-hydrolase [Xiamenia xianingshaonis]|nr:MBL fold metallo-hydrolase [Xiamenia xianingshaonis]